MTVECFTVLSALPEDFEETVYEDTACHNTGQKEAQKTPGEKKIAKKGGRMLRDLTDEMNQPEREL